MTTPDIDVLERLALALKGWRLDAAWLDTSEDDPAAVVGNIDDDGRMWPVATIDCDQYFHGEMSLPVAQFYATANPAAILSLIERLRKAEGTLREHDELRERFDRESA